MYAPLVLHGTAHDIAGTRHQYNVYTYVRVLCADRLVHQREDILDGFVIQRLFQRPQNEKRVLSCAVGVLRVRWRDLCRLLNFCLIGRGGGVPLNGCFQLILKLFQLRLQRLLVLRLLQQLQLVFHDLQVLRLPVIVDLGALHGGLGQCGVIAHQRRALLDAVALLDPHLLHRLALGDVDLLQFVRGHHAAGVGGVPPVVGHGALVDGVYVHVAPLGVPGDGQSAPHRAAHAHHAGGGDNGLFQLFAHARLLAVGALFADMQLFPQRQLLTHSRHLPTVRRPVWS